MMKQNLGKKDRILWIVIGMILVIISMYYIQAQLGQLLVGIIGILFLLSGIVGWSMIYYTIGYSSKGYGIDRITKRDIQRAVKENSIKTQPKIDIEIEKKNKQTKKVVKKSPSKKVTKKTAKKVTKKTVKKTTKKVPSKKVTKKTNK